MAMSASSIVDGGQHDTKYVTFELLMHAAFVANEIWGFMLETARMYVFLWFYVALRTYPGTWHFCTIPGMYAARRSTVEHPIAGKRVAPHGAALCC